MLFLMILCFMVIVAANYVSLKMVPRGVVERRNGEATIGMSGRGLGRGIVNMTMLAVLACAWLGLAVVSHEFAENGGFSDTHLLSLGSLIFGVINVFLLILRTFEVI